MHFIYNKMVNDNLWILLMLSAGMLEHGGKGSKRAGARGAKVPLLCCLLT